MNPPTESAPDGGPESTTGTFVRQRFAYDDGRQVTVFVPPRPCQAVVYAGDGELVAGWGPLLEAAGAPPTMIVGVHHTDAEDEWVRLGEYSPTIEPARFAAHERFVVDEVRAWVHGRFGVALPAARTAVCGVSAGAELALALGLRHPDVYGVVLAASPGGGFQPEELPERLPRVYLVAGDQEPFFAENAARWATALQDRGADVIMTERPGEHGGPFWAEEFPRMVSWAFGARGTGG